jgi:hypothetical protein
MTHLELENLISVYLEGEMDAARKVEVEAHLAGCDGCRTLLEDVRGTIQLCRETEELEPAPWLVSKILLATTGERKPSWRERLRAFLRPAVQPQLAYTVAMAVFSLSMLVDVAGINLRSFSLQDLNPRTWASRANRAGHLYYARVEKFYYDLRIVYEIESRIRQFQAPAEEPAKEAPKPESPGGGTTDRRPPGASQLASAQDPILNPLAAGGTTRSPSP